MFRFKEFTIHQELNAMKVGTDGVLLGAWSEVRGDCGLDIGTGTGLIALQWAQRSKIIHVDAVEVNLAGANEAVKNVTNSPWNDRIEVINSDITEFFPIKKYTSIVSNPPFYQTKSYSPDSKRTVARHESVLPFEELVKVVSRCLADAGVFSVIIPAASFEYFVDLTSSSDLYLVKKACVYPNREKTCHRVLLAFEKAEKKMIEEEIVIEESRHVYTKEYVKLTKDFYLKM